MKFALLSDNTINQVNGAAEVSRQLVRIFKKNGHEILFISPKESIYYSIHSKESIQIFSVPFWNYKECRISLPFSLKTYERIKNFKPDFLVTTTPFGIGQMGVLFKNIFKIPLLNFVLTDFSALNKYYGYKPFDLIIDKIQTHICKNAFINFTPSVYLKNLLENKGIENIKVFELGLANEFFSSLKHHNLKSRNNTIKNLLYVGRIAPDKNIIWLIDYVHKKNNVKLTIVGDGPLSKVNKNLPKDKFNFLGYKKGIELAQLYKKADLFVMPSIEEVGGMAIIEAIFSNVPVFIYDGKASSEIVDKYKSFSFRTKDEFYSKLNSLITVSMIDFAQQSWKINEIESNWERLYKMIINSCYDYFEKAQLLTMYKRNAGLSAYYK